MNNFEKYRKPRSLPESHRRGQVDDANAAKIRIIVPIPLLYNVVKGESEAKGKDDEAA
jgi:hypothetical protein